MKLKILILCFLSVGSLSFSKEPSSQFNGSALLFHTTANELLRHFVDEPYKADRYQVRDQVHLPHFLQAIHRTKVIVVTNSLINKGSPVLSRSLKKSAWRSIEEDFNIVSQYSRSKDFDMVVLVNSKTFQSNMAELMWTTFYQYLEVSNPGGDIFKGKSDYSVDYFKDVINSNQELSRELTKKKIELSKFKYKMDLARSELNITEEEIERDQGKLEEALEKRKPYIESYKEQAIVASNVMYDAFAEISSNMSFAGAGLGSAYRTRLIKSQKGLGRLDIEGEALAYKKSELEVMNDQISFYTRALKDSRDYFIKVRKKRREIALRELNS